MPPVFGPVSPSPTRLWSCAEPSSSASSPSHSANRETSSPDQAFLDHHRRARLAENLLVHHRVDRRHGFVHRHRHHDALARRQPIRLHHDWCAASPNELTRGLGIVEALPQGGGDAGRIGDFLGERLAALKLSRRLGRTTARDAASLHRVGNSGDQWRLRSGNDEVDRVVLRESDQGRDIQHADVDALGHRGDARGYPARNTASSAADCRRSPSTAHAPARPIRRPAPSSISPRPSLLRFHAPSP